MFDIDFKCETNNLNQVLLIDWFQCTFLFNEIEEIIDLEEWCYLLFKSLFNLDRDFLISEFKGINGYKNCISYNSIKMYFDFDRIDKGINLLLTGQGCREFENLDIPWLLLFYKLNDYNININRIDLAIDDFTDNYFTLDKIKKVFFKGHCISPFRIYHQHEEGTITDREILGYMLQFGSKASNCEITFYDKLKERLHENCEVDSNIKFWTRVELRFRHERAGDIFHLLLNNEDINMIAKGCLLDKIRFVKPNKNDTNKSRWDLYPWYKAYLENFDKLHLTTKTPESTITRKENWLKTSTSKSALMVILSKLDNISLNDKSVDFITNFLNCGMENITDKDMQIINDDRIKKGLTPFTKTDIYSYIKDIKNVIFLSKREDGILE